MELIGVVFPVLSVFGLAAVIAIAIGRGAGFGGNDVGFPPFLFTAVFLSLFVGVFLTNELLGPDPRATTAEVFIIFGVIGLLCLGMAIFNRVSDVYELLSKKES